MILTNTLFHKIHDISGLVSTTVLDTKIVKVENKIPDANGSSNNGCS